MKKSQINSYSYDKDIPVRENLEFRGLDKNTDNKKKSTNIVRKILLGSLFFLFLSIFIGSGFKVIKWYQDNKKTDEVISQIEEISSVEEVIDDNDGSVELVNETGELPESDYWYYVSFPLIQVNFDDLVLKNSDTVAWIQVNNTNINYPVVKTTNNDYYLTRSYDKSWNDAGWVFMDYRNSGTLNDRNTIIYAHSRLDKTMFGSLSKVLKSNWYKNKDNHIIKMSTFDENSLWQIFSVYKIEAEDYYITTDFSSDSEYMKFLTTLKNRSKYDFEVTLSESDSIITLSTCYSDTERTVVHAKKIKKSARNS